MTVSTNLRRLLRFRLLLDRGLHLLDNSHKRDFVGDREIGKNLAVQSDICGSQPLGETAIGETLRADRGVQALDPKIAECSFAGLAIALGPILALHGRIFRVAKEFRTAAAVTFGLI